MNKKVNTFEDLIVWEKAKDLTKIIYTIFNNKFKDYGFKDQIQRCSVSIMNNIAEGFERGSKKDFIRFLYISKGSCGELRSMIYLGSELNYITAEQKNTLISLNIEIGNMLGALIKKNKMYL